jgi:hypothetical protein
LIGLLAFTIPPVFNGIITGWQYAASTDSAESKTLPARLAGLARMTLVVIASPSSTPAAKPLSSAAAWTLGLGLGLIDFQRASAQFGSVQGGDGLIGFGSIWHFNKCKTAGAASLAVSDDADLVHVSVRLENGSQLGLSCGVG